MNLPKRLQVTIVVGAVFCVAAGWLAWKVYHQMHTPFPVLVIEGGR